MSERRKDPLEERARELCLVGGQSPDARVGKDGSGRGQPAWCTFRAAAKAEIDAARVVEVPAGVATERPQDTCYADAPLTVLGEHAENTLAQMKACMSVGNVVGATLCADGHLGYAQPVGAVIAYEGQISVSGVGFDIGCGNMAVRLDVPYAEIAARREEIGAEINRVISFGMGRTNAERVEHELFDDEWAWKSSGMLDYRDKARGQLGTVGSGNHYVDVLRDQDGFTWIGVHFGSRGLGHTTATRYLKAAGGRDGMNVPPTVLDVGSDLGNGYISGMHLAGWYARAGREWVVDRVRRIIGGEVTEMVHNHHNFAWPETHMGQLCWVVRKGATPAFPGQRGFVGGSMGDDAVILEGLATRDAQLGLYSTVHGAGRHFGRREAERRFTADQMTEWLRRQDVDVHLVGGGVDESPMAYKRLPSVLEAHAASVRVLHRLQPKIVVMAGAGVADPWKD